MNNVIELRDITVEFDGERVLDRLNLSIGDGEFVTLLGSSGCGKTTTLRVIAGFIQPQSGEVFFDGKSVAGLPPYKRPVNTIFQRYALFPNYNVYENIAFGLKLKKVPKDEIKERVTEMLRLVNLSGFENRSVTRLSGGQQQRVATCPSGAIYKREEDGIVLIDQDKCRGWRMCITGCPYKKIYFNWKSGKSEKCIFCYPRIEAGQPTVCSETCVGRIRYLGVLLYDADAIERAASTENEKDLYQRQLDVFLDPNDPKVIEQAIKDGIPLSVIEAAQQSPVYKMAMEWKLALPLHPEYRTLPMVWYVPPLSPIQSAADAGELGSNGILPDVESLRIPVQYLANLLTAGDTKPVLRALKRMLAMRHYKRAETVDGKVDTRALEEVGLTEAQAQEMYRYLAIANYEDRFVVPSSHRELAREAFPEKNGCGFTFGDGCHGSDTKFNLFNSRRIDAIDVTSKTEPHP